MLERQRLRASQRARAAMEPRLRPGETIRNAFSALTRVRWFVLALPLFPILFWMEWTGRDYTPYATAVWFGFVYMAYVRSFYVVQTDRRNVLLRLRRMSSKVVTDEWEVRGAPEYREGMISGFLTLEAGEDRMTLQVPAAFKELAREMASGSQQAE